MASLAIDVVLLPSKEMTEKAVEANRRLAGPGGGEIVLDEQTCLPHVSLVMGCIEDGDIEEVGRILEDSAGRYRWEPLRISGIHIQTNWMGQKISSFEIEKTVWLSRLHEELTLRLSRYLSYEVTEDMVLGAEVSDSTLQWIREYAKKSSFERFFPHITIGYGELGDFAFPREFSVSRLALCHLGNHCTCRKVLLSVPVGAGAGRSGGKI